MKLGKLSFHPESVLSFWVTLKKATIFLSNIFLVCKMGMIVAFPLLWHCCKNLLENFTSNTLKYKEFYNNVSAFY